MPYTVRTITIEHWSHAIMTRPGKLGTLLIALIGIAVYLNWDTISSFVGNGAGNLLSKDILPRDILPANLDPNTTTVYKWQDEEGQWHVSNQRPSGVEAVEVKQIHTDQNVVPSQPPPGTEQNAEDKKKADSGDELHELFLGESGSTGKQ